MAELDEYDLLDKQLEATQNGKSDHKRREGDGDRDKSRKDRDRGREGSSKDRHRSRDRERDRDKDRKDRRRSRSRSRDRDRSRSRRRSRSRDRKRSSRSRERRREPTPPEVRAQREREKELRELERDTRTVFAYNLNLKADERDIFEFFSRAGTVNDVKLIKDRNSGKSKGFAYIEYGRQEDILGALQLTGQQMMGQTVMVKASEAEKNLAWEAQQQAQRNQAAAAQLLGGAFVPAAGTGPCKLYVGNLPNNVAEEDLKPIFSPYGGIDFIQIQRDAAGNSAGYGYVQFSNMQDATKVLQQLNGLELAGGRALQLQIAGVGGIENVAALHPGELDEEDDYGGLKMSSSQRANLMNRLASAAGIQQPAGPVSLPPPPVPSAQPAGPSIAPEIEFLQGILGPRSPVATQCLLLKNMFDPNEESEENWDLDITEDVKEECRKYGEVLHAYVDKHSKGCVYLKFVSVEACEAAKRALHGRFFSGKQIGADYQFVQLYDSFFKL